METQAERACSPKKQAGAGNLEGRLKEILLNLVAGVLVGILVVAGVVAGGKSVLEFYLNLWTGFRLHEQCGCHAWPQWMCVPSCVK